MFFYETIGLEAFSNRKYPLKDPDWVHDADVARFNFFKKRGLSDSGETCPNEVPQSKYYFNNGQNFYWSDQTGLSITCEAGDIPGKFKQFFSFKNFDMIVDITLLSKFSFQRIKQPIQSTRTATATILYEKKKHGQMPEGREKLPFRKSFTEKYLTGKSQDENFEKLCNMVLILTCRNKNPSLFIGL